MLQNLVEMGFEEKDVLDALRISRNNQNDAVSCSLNIFWIPGFDIDLHSCTLTWTDLNEGVIVLYISQCDWLLGDRKTQPQDLDDGLDTNGAVYKAIMANPQVQLGLNNPRCLLGKSYSYFKSN